MIKTYLRTKNENTYILDYDLKRFTKYHKEEAELIDSLMKRVKFDDVEVYYDRNGFNANMIVPNLAVLYLDKVKGKIRFSIVANNKVIKDKVRISKEYDDNTDWWEISADIESAIASVFGVFIRDCSPFK